ncbi:MAG: sulfotransferase [Steroidobacteraceae bacterium]
MGATADPTGSVAMALEHAARLLERDPRLALEQSSEILKAVPNHPVATLIKGVAHRLNGETDVAVTVLSALSDAQHRWAQAHFERGLALADADRFPDAVKAVQRAVELKPDLPNALRTLGDFLTATGDAAGADEAYAAHIKVSTRDPRLLAPAAALHENRIPEAELLLREHLKQFPTDVAALRMLAEVAARLGRYADSAALLERCLELAPSFHAARQNYAIILGRQNRPAEALHHIEQLLAVDARNPSYRNLKAVMMARIGDYQESIEIYSKLLATHAASAKIWMSYGHALGTAGREADAIAAYRRAIQIAPHLGEAYWSLANLKTFRFMDEEVGAMRAQLARTDLEDTDRLHFDFALGKALEDVREYEACFAHYASGNLIRRRQIGYEPDQTTSLVRRSRQVYTREFFAARSSWGCEAPDPIFILGMPRAGSTLLEQILASHSSVEGTMELPNMLKVALSLADRHAQSDDDRYPGLLAQLPAGEFRRLGEQYLAETRIHRHTDKPLFIDKMPNNCLHVGLIHLLFPRARIIDARRHPLACGYSVFKQHFARGQSFSYGLEDIGRYYRDYVELMAHMDEVLPGRIHRVIYERMVEDTEDEVRRLLEYCGLPFEEACLHFYQNERAVKTASAQQVRRPIYREGVDHWRHFEPWLGPLKQALGPALDAYPGAQEY